MSVYKPKFRVDLYTGELQVDDEAVSFGFKYGTSSYITENSMLAQALSGDIKKNEIAELRKQLEKLEGKQSA